jgi:hypothetical protein
MRNPTMNFPNKCFTVSFIAFCIMGYYIGGPKPGQTDMQYLVDGSMPWQGHVANVVCVFALVLGFISKLDAGSRR